jgi:pyridinium-3,5-biscarboxylic acid mononucleotide synthase
MRRTSIQSFARVDHDRQKRRGFPEVIFCSGKTPDQVVSIAQEILSRANQLLASRADPSLAQIFKREIPSAQYHPEARMLVVEKKPLPKKRGTIAVVSAGTSDVPVSEEAAITAEIMGNKVKRFYDVGVAGIQRLLSIKNSLNKCTVIIVVAGMEGALPSVVAGLLDKPVIAVPTSVGYGTGMGGLSAILSMLNSCSSGITVVNIDNGFGAGYAASMINRQIS